MGEPQPVAQTKTKAPAAPMLRGDDVGASLDTDLARGLTSDDAARRLAEFGPNALEEKKVTLLDRLIRYFWGPIPWMIEAAAILSLVLKDWNDFAIITLMLLINAGVSFWQEAKAEDAIKVLKKQLGPLARVLRDGTWRTIAARELVPGDVVALKIGDVTPADMKLVSGDYLSTDKSALTGKSLPVDKKIGDPAYSGSIVKLGTMDEIVTATGTKTYFGRTAQLVEIGRDALPLPARSSAYRQLSDHEHHRVGGPHPDCVDLPRGSLPQDAAVLSHSDGGGHSGGASRRLVGNHGDRG